MKENERRAVLAVIAAALLITAGILVYRSFRPEQIAEPDVTAAPSPSELLPSAPAESFEPPEEERTPAYPENKLFITPERQRFMGDNLIIVIPRLNYKKEVGNGTSEAVLKYGPGLYEYAQLPSEELHNTSIAAHRRESDWYYLDKMTDGDFFYLVYGEYIYRYIYSESYVVEPSDWKPIFNKGRSMLTLTTCTPIGISDHRLIVTALLDEVIDYSEDYIDNL